MNEPSARAMRQTEYLRMGGRSPAAIARDEWRKRAEAGQHSPFEASTLGFGNPNYYLANRLELAFIAGWDARKAWEDAGQPVGLERDCPFTACLARAGQPCVSATGRPVVNSWGNVHSARNRP